MQAKILNALFYLMLAVAVVALFIGFKAAPNWGKCLFVMLVANYFGNILAALLNKRK